MKKALILSLLLLTGIIVLLATSPAYDYVVTGEEMAYRGHYKIVNGIPHVEVDGEKYRLLLAPEEALDTLGVKLVEHDTLYVEGVSTKNGILVTSLRADSLGEKWWSLRSHDLMYNYYDEPGKVHVDPKKCIGCKLCVPQCPVGAIEMVNGKAVIDTVRCVECGICYQGSGKWKGCPVKAISK